MDDAYLANQPIEERDMRGCAKLPSFRYATAEKLCAVAGGNSVKPRDTQQVNMRGVCAEFALASREDIVTGVRTHKIASNAPAAGLQLSPHTYT